MPRLHTLLFALALLAACASPPPATEPLPLASNSATPAGAAAPERAFPEDSLYSLLVAEFAIRRSAYDIALANYGELAARLRDPGISAHATHLSQFLRQDEETLQAASLWVELEPDNVEANNTLAIMLASQGETQRAIPYLAVVERKGGSAHFPVLLNGFDLLTNEQQQALVQGIYQLSTEFPQNTSLLLTQALLHTESQQYSQALDKLDQLLDLAPDEGQALLLEAKIRQEQGTRNPYKRLEKALEDDPDNAALRLQYARLLTATDMPAARQQFETLSAQAPGDGDLLFSLALINREIGDYLAAAAYLRQMLTLELRVDEANYYLGRINEDKGEPQLALPYYLAVGTGREFLPANSRAGTILLQDQQSPKFQRWFQQQRHSYPDQTMQLFALEVDLLSQSGAQREALAVLGHAVEESPDTTSLRYSRAMLREQLGDLKGMEDDLRMIIEAEPDNATALNALGYTLANRTTRFSEALTLITRALALEPDEPAILDSMGWALFRTGRHEEAIVFLTRAYTEFPDAEVAAHLGEVLWTTGETKAAREIWRGALLQAPDHPVLRGTLKRLQVAPLLPSNSSAGSSP